MAEVIFTGPAQKPELAGGLGRALPNIALAVRENRERERLLREQEEQTRAIQGLGEELGAGGNIQEKLASFISSQGGAGAFAKNPALATTLFKLFDQPEDVSGAISGIFNPQAQQQISETPPPTAQPAQKSFTVTPRDSVVGDDGLVPQQVGETRKIRRGINNLDENDLAVVDAELPEAEDKLPDLDTIRKRIITTSTKLSPKGRAALFADPLIERILKIADRVDDTDSAAKIQKMKERANVLIEGLRQQNKKAMEGLQQKNRIELAKTKADLKPEDEFETIANTAENRKKFNIPAGFEGSILQINKRTGKILTDDPQSGERIEVGPDGSVSIVRGSDITKAVDTQRQKSVLGATDALGKTSNLINQLEEGGQGVLGVAGFIGDVMNLGAQFTGELAAPKRDQFISSLRGTRTTTLRTMSDERGRFTEADFNRVKELFAKDSIWESLPSAMNSMFEIQAILLNRLVVNDADPRFLDAKALGVTPQRIAGMIQRNFLNETQAFRVMKLLFPGELRKRLAK